VAVILFLVQLLLQEAAALGLQIIGMVQMEVLAAAVLVLVAIQVGQAYQVKVLREALLPHQEHTLEAVEAVQGLLEIMRQQQKAVMAALAFAQALQAQEFSTLVAVAVVVNTPLLD
jgi:hypothetical protein